MSRYRYFLIVGVFLAIMVALAGQMLRNTEKSATRELRSALIGENLPEIDLPGLLPQDPILTNAQMVAGDNPILVNFFASWCVPCRAEHDALVALAARGDVKMIGIAYKDDPRDAAGFLAELGDPFALRGADILGRTGIDFGLAGVPESFLITADGQITYRHSGPIVGDALERRILPRLAALTESQTK